MIGDESSKTRVEVFVDPFCYDSQMDYLMWKTLIKDRQANESTLDDVAVVLNLFTLPYHPWSFLANIAVNVVRNHRLSAGGSWSKYDWDGVAPFLEELWNRREYYTPDWGDANYTFSNLTEVQVISEFADIARDEARVPRDYFMAGMRNRAST